MLFVGYGEAGVAAPEGAAASSSASAPSSAVPPLSSTVPDHHQRRPAAAPPRPSSASRVVHTVLSNAPSDVDHDAIEAELRFLYSEGMRLQQQQAFLSLLRHRVFRDLNRRPPAADRQSQGRASLEEDDSGHEDEEEREEGRLSSSSKLPRGLLQLHVLSLRSLSVLYEKQGEDEVAMRCLALAVSSAASSPSLVDSVLSMRLLLSRCALRLRLLPIARSELESVLAQRADDWEAIDLLTDALFCIGDQQALLHLTRHALSIDAGFVKGLLLYSQLQPAMSTAAASLFSVSASAAPPCRLLQHCHRTLQRIPQEDLRRVTAHLLSLSSPPRPPAVLPPAACLMRDVRLRRSDPLASIASILLSLYVEICSQQQSSGLDALTASPRHCLTVHELLRWLRARQARASAKDLSGQEELATPATQPAAVTASLLTPVILRSVERSSPTPSDDSDVLELSAEDEAARGGDAATMQGFMLSACAFLSAHCSSADCNSGVVDLIRRFLCWLRREDVEEAVSGVELCDLVLAALSASVHDGDDEDVDELLFMAEVLLDDVSTSPAAAAAEPVQHSALFSAATASSAGHLSSLMSRLLLLSVCCPERFIPWHSVRLFFLQAQVHVLHRYSSQALQCLLDCQAALAVAASSSSISALLVPHSRRHPRIDEVVLSRAIARVEQRRNRKRSKKKRW